VLVAEAITPNNDEYHHSLDTNMFSSTDDIHSLGLDIKFSLETLSVAKSMRMPADKITKEILYRLEYSDLFIESLASSSNSNSRRDIVVPGLTRFTHALGSFSAAHCGAKRF
jgi:hypothetical protein